MATTTLLTGARKQNVVVEMREDGREWWVMFNDGHVEVFDTAEWAMKAVRKAAARRNVSLTLTTLQWRNVPDGWKPPR